MGIATLLIGFLPGYATLGIAAPLILVLLHLCPGLGVGGSGAAQSCWPWSMATGAIAASGQAGRRWAYRSG